MDCYCDKQKRHEFQFIKRSFNLNYVTRPSFSVPTSDGIIRPDRKRTLAPHGCHFPSRHRSLVCPLVVVAQIECVDSAPPHNTEVESKKPVPVMSVGLISPFSPVERAGHDRRQSARTWRHTFRSQRPAKRNAAPEAGKMTRWKLQITRARQAAEAYRLAKIELSRISGKSPNDRPRASPPQARTQRAP